MFEKKFPRPFLCRFHLPNEIKVDPAKWEVALQGIPFPHSWFNIRKGYNKLHKIYHQLDLKDKNDIEESYPYHIIPISSTSMIREIEIPYGGYEQIESLIEKLNENEKKDARPFIYRYEKYSSKVFIKVPTGCGISFHESDIARCLVF